MKYSFEIDAALGADRSGKLSARLKFENGEVPPVPQVGDSIGFYKGRRFYAMTIEARNISYVFFEGAGGFHVSVGLLGVAVETGD